LLPGTLIGGRFEIARKAGAGGMGDIFHAVDRVDGVKVAVKLLRSKDHPEILRFEREAAILAELHHPGIVRYIAHGATPDGMHYLVMEWLEGEDLEQRFSRQRLTLAECLTIMRRTSTALFAAHSRGVLHRDLKPSNVFLVSGEVERAKLLDFGIARLAEHMHRLTHPGVLVGTPGYMAPEQVKGARGHDPRIDVFSLGCVFFECLAGRPAFEGDHTIALLAKILLQDVPRLRRIRSDVPEPLERLIARMMAKDPDNRPLDASEVSAEIDRLSDELTDTRPISVNFTDTTSTPQSASQPPSRDHTSLTLREQRLVSVVLTGAPSTEDAQATREIPALPLSHFGGRLNVLADGSMLVTIGGAGSVIDRALHAARCALDLQARFPDVPICVVTGRGVAAARVVEGEVLDRGARTLSATSAGMIQLDHATVDLISTRFLTELVGDMFVLHGERDLREATPLLLGKPSPCVGRARELAMLEGMFTSILEEPMACAVLVTGPAGVGKSRLSREFVEALRRRGEPVEILTGRADSIGESSPFAILADALRRAAGIVDGEPLESRRLKLTERLSRHLEGETLTRLRAFLGELIRTPFPDDDNQALKAARSNAQIMGDAMCAAWEDWLTTECAVQPVVLVLEDLHSGDAATVRMLDATLRNLHSLPLFLLVLARPAVHTRFPALWVERQVQMIKLGPLIRKASEQLVRDALGREEGDALVAQIVERADGNPFYLEELIRAVAAGRGDAFPDSMLGTVEARLDAEGSEAKRILRAASVFGERFSTRGVAALLGGEQHLDEAGSWLSALAAREIVAAVRASELTADAGYIFRHALVRETVYATLTEDDRALGHRLAGAWLEQSGHTDALAMAEHFCRGGEPLRAVRWFRRAAEQALEADDLPAVLEHAERGVASGASGEDLGALRLAEAEAHVWRGEMALAEQRGVEAGSLLAPGTEGWFHAIQQVLIAVGKLGGFDHIEQWVAVAAAVTVKPSAQSARTICLSECAGQLIFGGHYAAADALIQALEPTDGLDAEAAAMLQQTRAFRASAAGDSGRCLEGLQAALTAFERAGDRRNACVTRANIGFILTELGDFAGAEDALRGARSSADRMGLYDISATALHNLGHVLAYRGDIEEARRLEQLAIAQFEQQGTPRLMGLARTYLAKIELLAGDGAAAEREARAAADALMAAPPLRAAALAVLARSLLTDGRSSEALDAAGEAFTLLSSLGSLEEGEALVRLVYAEALAAAGKEREFAATIAEARERLLARAAKISDPSFRERFLTQVPDNAQTLALSAAADDAPRLV
jgi:serine/threonine protein kinase/tetratricopeptide (TPR) repeat protein